MGESNIYLLLISIKIWQLETLQFTRQTTYLLFSCRGVVIGKTGKKQKGTRQHHDMGVLPA